MLSLRRHGQVRNEQRPLTERIAKLDVNPAPATVTEHSGWPLQLVINASRSLRLGAVAHGPLSIVTSARSWYQVVFPGAGRLARSALDSGR